MRRPGFALFGAPPELGRGSPDTMIPVPTDGLLVCRYEGPWPSRAAPPLAAAALLGRPGTDLADLANALPARGAPSCPAPLRTSTVVLASLGPDGGPLAVVDLQCS